LAKNCTALVIALHLRNISSTGQILVFDGGEIEEHCVRADLQAMGRLYAQLRHSREISKG
jgi:ABC-type transport system involved in Fe-S cluster assembly fused permease/ATPase subunit